LIGWGFLQIENFGRRRKLEGEENFWGTGKLEGEEKFSFFPKLN